MNKSFFNEHPFIALLMVVSICDTAIIITKFIKGDKKISLINIDVSSKEKDNKEDKAE